MVWIGPWTTGPSFTSTACHTLSMPSAMMCTPERSVHMLLNLVTSSATALPAAGPGPVRCSDLFDRSHVFWLQLVSRLIVIFLNLVTHQVCLVNKLLTVFQLTYIWRDGSYLDLFKELQGRSRLHCRMRRTF